jgi:hypothetical protein
MPNTKEKGKLIEVLSKHIIAEELMAEGVTVQECNGVDADGCPLRESHV